MYGFLRVTYGSNPLGVDDENDFPNALITIYKSCKWGQNWGHYNEFNFHYITIWIYFVEFHSIWRSLPIISPKVETSLFASDLREL